MDKIEKQFFETFEIKPKELIFKTMNCACGCHDCQNCDKYKNNYSKTYPQITDHILLELICKTKGLVITQDCNSVKQLKDGVLKVLISLAQIDEDIKQQVHTLFEEI